MEPFKYGESSTRSTQKPARKNHASSIRRLHDARGREIIEIDGDSEDEDQVDEPAHARGQEQVFSSRGRLYPPSYIHEDDEAEETIEGRKGLIVGRHNGSSEAEEPIEKGKPPRKRPRYKEESKSAENLASGSRTPINLVSSSPPPMDLVGENTYAQAMAADTSIPTTEHSDSLSPCPTESPVRDSVPPPLSSPSPVDRPGKYHISSIPDAGRSPEVKVVDRDESIATREVFPTPAPESSRSLTVLSDPGPSSSLTPVPEKGRHDFARKILPALDVIYDGGRGRPEMTEHEQFNILSHNHITEDHAAVMLTWSRYQHQHGPMYFTHQVQYLEDYLKTYGAIVLQFKVKGKGEDALKAHFRRLYGEGRLDPPYQSTPKYMTVKRRNKIMMTSAMKVLLEICKKWDKFCKEF